MTNFNPLAKILDENRLSGPNYVDQKRNLIIVLTADKIVHVLNTESPELALADATKELGGLRYTGQIRLGGSSTIHISQLHSLVDYLPLGGRQRSFTPRASVSSLITHRVLSLCLHLSSLNLCHLISVVNVVLFGLKLLINSVICLCLYSAH